LTAPEVFLAIHLFHQIVDIGGSLSQDFNRRDAVMMGGTDPAACLRRWGWRPSFILRNAEKRDTAIGTASE